MLARRISGRILAAVVAVELLTLPVFVHAAPPAVVADQTVPGTIVADDSLVRSGPGVENYYATTRLNKGDHVAVIGTHGDWLMITPPPGSFCYVGKAWVTRDGDTDRGTISQPDAGVRTGSLLNDSKLTRPMHLNVGDAVTIVGDTREYFKIAPPAGSCLYIEKAAVDLTPVAAATPAQANPGQANPGQATPGQATPAQPAAAAITPASGTTASGAPASASATPPSKNDVAMTTMTPAAPASTQPADAMTANPTTNPTAVAVAPTTKPSEPTAQTKFDGAEQSFADASAQPLEQQPLDTLTSQYSVLATDSTLPDSERKIVDMRLSTLRLRADAKTQYLDAMKMQADARSRRQAQKSEQDELAERIKQDNVMMYTAVGTLRASSLIQTGTTLYRICDPVSGRTMVYVRTNDPKYAALLNQFVGLKGDLSHDDAMNLKILTPTDGVTVDQSKVGTTIAATMVPPSMAGKSATASTGNQ
jgi:hypothetical protein